MKKMFKRLCMLVSLCIMLMGMTCMAHAAEKKPDMKMIEVDYSGKAIQCGDYYFKYNGSKDCFYMGKSKDSIKKKTPLKSTFCSDGKKAYYIVNDDGKAVMYSYNLESYKKKEEKVLASSVKRGVFYGIRACHENYIYYTRWTNHYNDNGINEPKFRSYYYNVSTGSSKIVLKEGEILTGKNGAIVTTTSLGPAVKPVPLTLRKVKSNGMLTDGKVVCKKGFCPTFVGKKLYFAYYPKVRDNGYANMQYVKIKRCSLDGSAMETLGTANGTGKDSNGNHMDSDLIAEKITSKYVILGDYCSSYRFTYSTKKLVPNE